MKIFKNKKTSAKSEQSIVTLNKAELQNVIGGTDTVIDPTTTDPADSTVNTTRSNIKHVEK
jgi:bacteriocin-like protein